MSGTSVLTPVEQAGDEYWRETRRPLVCLLFLTPLLAAYEWGVLWTGEPASEVRNRADVWMRSGLTNAGLEHPLVLPGAVVAILLGWHVFGRFSWGVRPSAFVGMLAESLLFAFVLVLLGQFQGRVFPAAAALTAALPLERETAALAVSFLGAGLYEELLFRLMLLPAIYGVLRLVRLTPPWAGAAAVVLSGVAFAAAHHLETPGVAVPWSVFAFRAGAGAFFAGLFYWRGFGITVGAHAAYDLLVGIVLAGDP
ncbi:MAG TPA: CPBP family intramembrane glutamic endopeptidase [Planctomycetaceae bacterium]|nr:CPBP family intramembrane glutamic endopeptidase [Planctomycetaceae bacterium]